MTRETTRIPLIAMSPGTSRAITVHRYGAPGARPKAYLQAGIHADEIPGMLVLHHLVRRLDEAAPQGEVVGVVVIGDVGLAGDVVDAGQVANTGLRVELTEHGVGSFILEERVDRAVRILGAAKGEGIRRAGLGACRDLVRYVQQLRRRPAPRMGLICANP